MSKLHAMTDSPSPAIPRVVDLGTRPYAAVLDLQRRINQAVIDKREPATLLLVEHEPVVTLSRRNTAPGHLLASREQLRAMGIAVEETDRGGDITYHGPGQLVAYPILRMNDFNLNLSRYMRLLEAIVIRTLARFNVAGQCDGAATGVWVKQLHQPSQPLAKICAMGVRIRRNVTMHGLALNVTTNLDHFQTIIPCGLTNRPVTSMQQILNDQCPTMVQVKKTFVEEMQQALQELEIEKPKPV